MKASLGPLVGQLSGSIGGMVASRNRYGPYFRRRAHPTTSTTELSLATKARLATASQAWVARTDPEREAWRVWAANNPITDRLGEKQVLQGNAAFVQINALRLRIIGTILTVPPVIVSPAPLESVTLTGDIGAGTFEVGFSPTPLGGAERLLLWGALVDNDDVQYIKNKLRIVGWSSPAQVSPYDWQTEFTARFGALAVGQRVFCQAVVYNGTSSLWSLPIRDAVTITST